MAYQKISSERSTRFPFMGLGCNSCDGLGAVSTLPGYDAVAQYYKDLVGRVQRELYHVRVNESAYTNAIGKITRAIGTISPTAGNLAARTVTFSIAETQQLVLQLLGRTGAAIVAAKTLEGAYQQNYPRARDTLQRTLTAARNGLAAVTVFVQQLTQARTGTSGLGDGELLPALGVGALVAIVLSGLPGLNVIVGGAVAYVVYNALRSVEQAAHEAITLGEEWCRARQRATGQACTPEEFAAQVERYKNEIIAADRDNPINNIIDRLVGAGTSALKTVLIVGGVAVIGYIGVSLLMRKAAKAII